MVFLFGTILFGAAFAFSWYYRNSFKKESCCSYYAWRAACFFYLFMAILFGVLWVGGFEEPIMHSTADGIRGFPAYFKETCIENEEYCFPLMNNAIFISSTALYLQKQFLLYCCDVIDMECDVPVILSTMDKIVERHFASL
jgi:hypothetical protein